MKPFRPTPTHLTLHQRVKARQWASCGVNMTVPVASHLSHLSDEELDRQGLTVVYVKGKRHLRISIHRHE